MFDVKSEHKLELLEVGVYMITFDLITSCSSTRTEIPKVRVGDLPRGLTMRQALNEWLTRLNQYPHDITPREQYRGQGFVTLAKICEVFKPNSVSIVTGGLGLTDIDEKIVPYDFTASPHEPENIHQVVTAEPYVQTIWWRLINEARGKWVNPVGHLVETTPADFVIIACSKIFLRYISDDILSVSYKHREKIRILLSASSQGSVPAQLRPMMLPFERSFVSHLPGNRSDGNHRAAYQYLEMITNDPDFAQKTTSQQRPTFMDLPKALGTLHAHDSHVPYGRTKVDLEAFLRERPQYLELPWEAAFTLSRRELGVIGGRLHFRGLLRKLKDELNPTPPVIATGDDRGSSLDSGLQDDEAISALGALGLSTTSAIEDDGSNDEEAVLALCRVFIGAVKAANPRAVFQAADVCRWAGVYWKSKHPDRESTTLPRVFDSPKKLAHLIKANKGTLGLLDIGSGSSKAYCLA